MRSATEGTLLLAGEEWQLTGDPAAKRFHGLGVGGSRLELRIVNRSLLTGTLDGAKVRLGRVVLRPIPAAELAQFDAGPAGAIKAAMEATPDYQAEVGDTTTFWYAFGPVLYRGRVDGSARVMCIASDPGPSECLPFARRTLVGDSGQKTQGLLHKIGLTRSYVLVNAFAVAMRPSKKARGLQVLRSNVAIRAARHAFYDQLLAGWALEAIIALGDVAHLAYDLWAEANPELRAVRSFKLPHPAAVDRDASGNDPALKAWAQAVEALRSIVTPDADGDASGPNFGDYFTELDYARIARRDLPKVAPAYIGDDSWGRAANPRHNNCCERPSPDDGESLDFTPPPGQGSFLRYTYHQGKLARATDANGRIVAVDAVGIPR
jgi:uracil-DNA glycosylase